MSVPNNNNSRRQLIKMSKIIELPRAFDSILHFLFVQVISVDVIS